MIPRAYQIYRAHKDCRLTQTCQSFDFPSRNQPMKTNLHHPKQHPDSDKRIQRLYKAECKQHNARQNCHRRHGYSRPKLQDKRQSRKLENGLCKVEQKDNEELNILQLSCIFKRTRSLILLYETRLTYEAAVGHI